MSNECIHCRVAEVIRAEFPDRTPEEIVTKLTEICMDICATAKKTMGDTSFLGNYAQLVIDWVREVETDTYKGEKPVDKTVN